VPWLRAGLVLLALSEAFSGAWAILAPRAFYSGFPIPGHAWVAMLPPFSEHLLFDYGALTLSLTVTLGAAAIRPGLTLIRTALAAYLVFAAPHFAFHVLHLAGFPTVDAVAQTVATGLLAAIAIALLIAMVRPAVAGRCPP
jgi:hypothetical protein